MFYWIDVIMVFILLMIILTFFLDTQLHWGFWGLSGPWQLSFVFLTYLFLKRQLSEVVWALIFFALCAHAQSVMSLSEIVVPYLFLFFVVGYFKKLLMTETYLYEACVVTGLFILFLNVQALYYDFEGYFVVRYYSQFKLLPYAIFHGLVAFVSFIFLDIIFDKIDDRKNVY